jgi:hypothetical protein
LFFVCLVVGGVVLNQDFHPSYPSFERVTGVLLIYTIVVLPGFLFLATTRSVQWWQLTIVALFLAAIYVALSGRYGAIYGPSYILWLALRCTVASCIFWVAGIWRNPRFPDVGRALPLKSFAILLPVLVAVAIGFVSLSPSKVYGYAIDARSADESASYSVAIQLLDGETIQASMMHVAAPVPAPRRCAEMNTRRALTIPQWRRYWIENTYKCDSNGKPDTSTH